MMCPTLIGAGAFGREIVSSHSIYSKNDLYESVKEENS